MSELGLRRQEMDAASSVHGSEATHPPLVKRSMQTIEHHPEWSLVARIPMRLAAGIPLPRFTVRDLLHLHAGQVVSSTWDATEDVPVTVGEVQLGMSEFEVVEQKMAVRLTRLA